MSPVGTHPGSKILVVDDNAENRALAQATLEDEGYEVVLASDGAAGLRAFEELEPDCVLLDVRMPGLDGFAVCARIRELPRGKETPVVFLTALRDVDTFDRALRAGGDDFLTKPIRPTELVLRVHAALRLGRMSSELREHYDLVKKQRDDLLRLQLQKERLIAFVVHDLKAPLTTLGLHIELLMRNDQMPARARDWVSQMKDESQSMMRLILNLLDISKGEEGQLVARTEEVDFNELSRVVLETLRVLAKDREVELEPAIHVSSIKADSDLIRRVLENLLDNAIRHAPEASRVRLSAEADGDHVEIAVADQGPGIPAELRDRVFERYYQVEPGQAARAGRGLGLTFCKLAVEAHGGRIWVDDAAGGTTFRISLPR